MLIVTLSGKHGVSTMGDNGGFISGCIAGIARLLFLICIALIAGALIGVIVWLF